MYNKSFKKILLFATILFSISCGSYNVIGFVSGDVLPEKIILHNNPAVGDYAIYEAPDDNWRYHKYEIEKIEDGKIFISYKKKWLNDDKYSKIYHLYVTSKLGDVVGSSLINSEDSNKEIDKSEYSPHVIAVNVNTRLSFQDDHDDILMPEKKSVIFNNKKIDANIYAGVLGLNLPRTKYEGKDYIQHNQWIYCINKKIPFCILEVDVLKVYTDDKIMSEAEFISGINNKKFIVDPKKEYILREYKKN